MNWKSYYRIEGDELSLFKVHGELFEKVVKQLGCLLVFETLANNVYSFKILKEKSAKQNLQLYISFILYIGHNFYACRRLAFKTEDPDPVFFAGVFDQIRLRPYTKCTKCERKFLTKCYILLN